MVGRAPIADRSEGEWICAHAAATANFDRHQRFWATTALIRHAIPAGIAEAKIFDIAYGDASASEYWATWPVTRMAVDQLKRLIVLHTGKHVRPGNSLGLAPRLATSNADLSKLISGAPAELLRARREAGDRVDTILPGPLLCWIAQHAPNALPAALLPHLKNWTPAHDSAVERSPAPDVQVEVSVATEGDFVNWVKAERDSGRGPPSARDAEAWARARGRSRDWSRDQRKALSGDLRLASGQSRSDWRSTPKK